MATECQQDQETRPKPATTHSISGTVCPQQGESEAIGQPKKAKSKPELCSLSVHGALAGNNRCRKDNRPRYTIAVGLHFLNPAQPECNPKR